LLFRQHAPGELSDNRAVGWIGKTHARQNAQRGPCRHGNRQTLDQLQRILTNGMSAEQCSGLSVCDKFNKPMLAAVDNRAI